MKPRYLLPLALLFSLSLNAQLYFPPSDAEQWETIPAEDLGWCQTEIDTLYDFLEDNNTKAFIVLKDGKIVLEQYFNEHDANTNWYWASAGKTLMAFLTGLAQQEGYLSIDAPTSDYLGEGWTDCAPEQEAAITVWNQLTMTSGLDDGVAAPFCTLDTCLQCLAAPGTRWAYHNGPYTLLRDVVENATGLTINTYHRQRLRNPIGMDGFFIEQGYNNLYLSTARSMARFGLLILNHGNWAGTPIMADTAYFNAMVTPSQELNESYGYLWWLNGQSSYMIPQLQLAFDGPMAPNAPDDMISALGKNGQIINVVPSQNLVMIRMGNAPEDALVPFLLNDQIWGYFNELDCNPVATQDGTTAPKLRLFPNPAADQLYLELPAQLAGENYLIYDALGRLVQEGQLNRAINIQELNTGVHTLVWKGGAQRFVKR